MPTDLPPDYKPKPVVDPDNPADANNPGANPVYPPATGEDAIDETGGPAGKGADVVDPPGWAVPPLAPGDDALGVPAPAGTPSF